MLKEIVSFLGFFFYQVVKTFLVSCDNKKEYSLGSLVFSGKSHWSVFTWF